MLQHQIFLIQVSTGERLHTIQFPDVMQTFKKLQAWQNAPKAKWLRVFINGEKVYEWIR